MSRIVQTKETLSTLRANGILEREKIILHLCCLLGISEEVESKICLVNHPESLPSEAGSQRKGLPKGDGNIKKMQLLLHDI